MKISRDNQKFLAERILRILGRGLCAVSMFDKRVAAEIEALGDGFSFSVYAGISDCSPNISLKTENGRLVRIDEQNNGFDVIIRFKDLSGIMPVLLGRISVAAAFAQHRILVWGNISHAVALVRIVDITEAYLLPKGVVKKVIRGASEKQVPSLFIYLMLPFAPLRKQKTASGLLDYEETSETGQEQFREPPQEHVQQELRAVE